jgi:hypothetical protein
MAPVSGFGGIYYDLELLVVWDNPQKQKFCHIIQHLCLDQLAGLGSSKIKDETQG